MTLFIIGNSIIVSLFQSNGGTLSPNVKKEICSVTLNNETCGLLYTCDSLSPPLKCYPLRRDIYCMDESKKQPHQDTIYIDHTDRSCSSFSPDLPVFILLVTIDLIFLILIYCFRPKCQLTRSVIPSEETVSLTVT